jgi:hypothetical protein
MTKITISSKKDLTDQHLLQIKDSNISQQEYSDFIMNNKISNKIVEELLFFICNNEEKTWIPEKCDAYEPIRESFNVTDYSAPIRWVCQPGGALYLKKSKKNSYTLVIENERFMPIWDEYGKRLKPKAKESSILSRVELYFDDKIYKYKTQESIDNFIKGISKILKSDTILIDSK